MVHSFPTRRSSDLQAATQLNLAPPAAAPGTQIAGWRSEEHTSELQSHHPISYAVFCLKKKKESMHSRSIPSRNKMDNLIFFINFHLHYLFCPVRCIGYVISFFFFNDTATTEIYTGWYTLSLHDALPI